jgi:hypothetical protein
VPAKLRVPGKLLTGVAVSRLRGFIPPPPLAEINRLRCIWANGWASIGHNWAVKAVLLQRLSMLNHRITLCGRQRRRYPAVINIVEDHRLGSPESGKGPITGRRSDGRCLEQAEPVAASRGSILWRRRYFLRAHRNTNIYFFLRPLRFCDRDCSESGIWNSESTVGCGQKPRQVQLFGWIPPVAYPGGL